VLCVVQLKGVRFPHDFAFSSLPTEHVTTSTPVIIYVTETPPDETRPAKLHRFVLRSADDGWTATAQRRPADLAALVRRGEGLRKRGGGGGDARYAALPFAGYGVKTPNNTTNVAMPAAPEVRHGESGDGSPNVAAKGAKGAKGAGDALAAPVPPEPLAEAAAGAVPVLGVHFFLQLFLASTLFAAVGFALYQRARLPPQDPAAQPERVVLLPERLQVVSAMLER
jgi:hypothetical protein